MAEDEDKDELISEDELKIAENEDDDENELISEDELRMAEDEDGDEDENKDELILEDEESSELPLLLLLLQAKISMLAKKKSIFLYFINTSYSFNIVNSLKSLTDNSTFFYIFPHGSNRYYRNNLKRFAYAYMGFWLAR